MCLRTELDEFLFLKSNFGFQVRQKDKYHPPQIEMLLITGFPV